MTGKQNEVMQLINECGYVRVVYGATVSGVRKNGAVVNLKRSRNALVSLVNSGMVKRQTTELSDVRYTKAEEVAR
jgi:hypothetical protein